MKTTGLLVLLLSVATYSNTLAARISNPTRKQSNLPAWVDCTSNNDCAPGYCCTISHERYSYPHCQEMQAAGDFCRPGGPLITNGTRSYPDGLGIELGNVYLMFCPCAPGLACDPSLDVAECRDPRELNLLQGDDDDQ